MRSGLMRLMVLGLLVALVGTPQHVAMAEAFQPLPAQQLQPIRVPHNNQGKSIAFKKVVLDVRRNDIAGELRRGLLCVRPIKQELRALKIGFSQTVYADVVRSELEANNYRYVESSDNLFEDAVEPDVDYLLAAKIFHINVTSCKAMVDEQVTKPGKQPKRKMTVLRQAVMVSVEWQVYDRVAKTVVLKVATSGAYKSDLRKKETVAFSMENAFHEAARDLMASRDFYHLIAGDEAVRLSESEGVIGLSGLTFDAPGPFQKALTKEGLVEVTTASGSGYGFVLNQEGYILASTANIGGLDHVMVILPDGSEAGASVLRTNPTSDVALLKLAKPNAGLVPLSLRRSAIEVGKVVQMIGGQKKRRSSRKLYKGTVAAVVEVEAGHTIIFSDEALSSGRLGSPLLDINGNVVGVKIRDFAGDTTPEDADRFLTIGDALSALLIHAME